MLRKFADRLVHDLEAPVEVRGFGSGWFSGFAALVLGIIGLGFVVALRWPGLFGMPELDMVREWPGFRPLTHITLLAAYALALLSLLLRPRKVIGLTALVVALTATILGGSNVQPDEARAWGAFFGI